MAKLTFTTEQIEFIKASSDVLLRNSGTTYLKDVSILLDKLNIQDADYNSQDIKTLQILCDIALKASGLLQLKNVISMLNLLAASDKKVE